MHILFITGEYPPMRGGVGAYTATLADALVAQGVEVSVLSDEAAAKAPVKRNAVPVFPQRRWDPAIWQSVPQLAQAIRADWVHVQYQTAAFAMNPAINLAPAWWRRAKTHRERKRLYVAWTYHDLLVPYLFPKAGAHLRRWITARPAHMSDLAIVTNEADRLQLVEDEHIDPKKIPIGSNIDAHHLTPEERAARRAQRGYRQNQLILGYFGFLNRSKGGLTLIRTLDRLVQQGYDVHLLMIGERVGSSDPTNFAYLHEVETLIGERGLSNRVRWTGHQIESEVSADLAAIDLLLMPYVDGASLRRGTLMAGLAHGCAIVTTTPQDPLPELVDGRDLLYFTPENVIAAADAVSRLVENPALRQSLQARALRKSEQFTWHAIAQSHLEHYRAISNEVGQ
ncbi:MAG: glycosyltransferase family 4 protein [Caldilineaceae bacterium]|nr:glycosyltransferase family 4 protein [Caldilineaceae bacterium]